MSQAGIKKHFHTQRDGETLWPLCPAITSLLCLALSACHGKADAAMLVCDDEPDADLPLDDPGGSPSTPCTRMEHTAQQMVMGGEDRTGFVGPTLAGGYTLCLSLSLF